MTNEEAKSHMDMSIAHKDMALKYHTCGRCKWEKFPFICHQCKWGEDVRKDLWKLKDELEEKNEKKDI